MMMMSSLPQSSWSVPLLPKFKPFNGDFRPVSVPVNYRGMRTSAGVPDFFSANWLESQRKRPDGPRLNFSAEEAVEYQLDALKHNDQPREDYGIEVYVLGNFHFPIPIFLHHLDLILSRVGQDLILTVGQFERFRRIFHHSTHRVLLGHKERTILSSLLVEENQFKQRVLVRGNHTEEEDIFQFTMVQRIGGLLDGYWLTESVLHDGDVFDGGLAY
ncbi:hypothetical protein LINPERHAP1_LOCUS39662 [Linum perenne]